MTTPKAVRGARKSSPQTTPQNKEQRLFCLFTCDWKERANWRAISREMRQFQLFYADEFLTDWSDDRCVLISNQPFSCQEAVAIAFIVYNCGEEIDEQPFKYEDYLKAKTLWETQL